MKKVLSAILVFVFLCLIVAYETLNGFDKSVSSQIIAQLSEKTGRSVYIQGKTEISFSLSPSVRISDIKVQNASWAMAPDMLRVGALEIQVDFFPLFHRKAVLKKINLKDVLFDFEEYSDGQKSWTLLPEKEKKSSDAADKKTFQIAAGQITAENVQFVYRNFSESRVYKAQFDTLTLKDGPEGAEISSKWVKDDKAYDVVLNAKSSGGNNAYVFDLNVGGNGLSVSVNGDISDPYSNPRVKSVAKLHTEQAALLNKLFGLSLPEFSDVNVTAQVDYDAAVLSVRDFSIRAGTKETAFVSADGTVLSLSPLAFRAHTEISALSMGTVKGLPALPVTEAVADVEWGKKFALRDFKMSAGDSNLFGYIEAYRDPSLFVVGRISSERFSLPDFIGRMNTSEAERNTEKEKNPAKTGKLFSAGPLPYEALKDVEIDVEIKLAEVTAMDGSNLGSFNPAVKMKDGVFELSGFDLAGYAKIGGRFDSSKRPAELNADITLNEFPLEKLFIQKKVERGTLNSTIHLEGKGNSEAEIASSIGGHLFAQAKDVYISSYRLMSLPKKLASSLKVQEEMPISISCAVANIPAKNGYFSLQNAIGVESNVANLQTKGDLDLSDERIRMEIETEIKLQGVFKALFDSVSVRGRLRKPDVEIDINRSVSKMIAVGLAYLTGGKKAAQEHSGNPPLRNVCATALAKEGKVLTDDKKK